MPQTDTFRQWDLVILKIEVKLPFMAGKVSPSAVGVLRAAEMLSGPSGLAALIHPGGILWENPRAELEFAFGIKHKKNSEL